MSMPKEEYTYSERYRIMNYSDDEEEEGIIHSPKRNKENRRFQNPESLDFQTWKEKVGKLVRSENVVLMNDDNELRDAISQAIFLNTASENLLKKRKRQLELLDECRVGEGVAGKKLFEENEETIRQQYGPRYMMVANQWKAAFERASRPLEAPDIRRPPPTHMVLPPMHIPPPSLSIPIASSSSTTLVTSEMSRAAITSSPLPPLPMMSRHLLPPQIGRIKKEELKQEVREAPVSLVEDHTSWRRPYKPIAVPPPRVMFPFNTNFLPPPPLQTNFSARRHSFGNDKSSIPLKAPSSPPGIVGVNVRGVYIGDRQLIEKKRRSHH